MPNNVYIDFDVRSLSIIRSARSREPIPSGNQNHIFARFTFTSDWDELNRIAVFSRNNQDVFNVPIVDRVCPIPNEILASPGTIMVSVFGGDRRTVDSVALEVVQGGFKQGVPPSPPEPSSLFVQSPDSTVPFIREYNGDFEYFAYGEWNKIQGGGGESGYDGWTPVFALVQDGERDVVRITNWTGGGGAKPAIGYLGTSGIVSDKFFAVDIRGGRGEAGSTGQNGAPGRDGEDGVDGVDGEDGNSATITIRNTTSVPYNEDARVVNVGTESEAILDFYIKQGIPGENAEGPVKLSGMQFPGDSITNYGIVSARITSMVSDSNGSVTVTMESAPSSSGRVGDAITIHGILPLEFNGDYFITNVVSTTVYVVNNTKVALNTTGTQMWTSPPGSLILRTVYNFGYHNAAAALCGQVLPDYRVDGVGSTRAAQWAENIDTLIFQYNAKYIHVLLGTNDLLYDMTAEQLIPIYQGMLEKMLARGCTVLVGTVVPHDATESMKRIVRFNSWLRQFASAHGITVVDYFSVLIDNATGLKKTVLYTDAIHPNESGRFVMAQLLAGVLREMFPFPSNYLPVSSVETFSNGVNLLSDPLLTSATAGTASGRTGTAVVGPTSKEIRLDGFGNDYVINASYVDTTGTVYSATRINAGVDDFVAERDCKITPIVDVFVQGSSDDAISNFTAVMYYTKNAESIRSINLIATTALATAKYSEGIRWTVKGQPVYVRVGDTITVREIRVPVYGRADATATIKTGRVMLRIEPVLRMLNG